MTIQPRGEGEPDPIDVEPLRTGNPEHDAILDVVQAATAYDVTRRPTATELRGHPALRALLGRWDDPALADGLEVFDEYPPLPPTQDMPTAAHPPPPPPGSTPTPTGPTAAIPSTPPMGTSVLPPPPGTQPTMAPTMAPTLPPTRLRWSDVRLAAVLCGLTWIFGAEVVAIDPGHVTIRTESGELRMDRVAMAAAAVGAVIVLKMISTSRKHKKWERQRVKRSW